MEPVFIDNKKKSIGVLGAFGLSVGTAIGWGSFVVTGSDYLSQAGLIGSIIGILIGALLIGVIAYCYHYMMNHVPDSGGIYSFIKHTFNGDHAFLAAWFMIIIYAAILWANVTSVALFARFLFPGVFSFGYLYSVAGYEVYLGEILLCSAVLLVVGGITFLHKKISTYIAFGLVALFAAIILFVAIFAIVAERGIPISEVAFAPGKGNPFQQIMAVFAMSPWAFVGFESISHSTGSFAFKTSKTFKILLASLITSTIVYILLCQISVMAHPDAYASWYDYIANNQEAGIMGVPPFFVAQYYLGQAGVVLFGIALMAILITSIIGNIFALSNLIQRMAEDGIFPKGFAYVNKRDIPVNVRIFILAITLLAFFLGKSAISFIIDVNNFCGVVVYAYVSAAALAMGRWKRQRVPFVCGIIGVISAIIFGIANLVPLFTSAQSIAQETFIVFVVCMLLGFIFFAITLRRDEKGNFGNSSVTWVALTIISLLFSGIWIFERSKRLHAQMMDTIEEASGSGPVDIALLHQVEGQMNGKLLAGLVTLFVILSMNMIVLFFVLEMIRRKSNKQQEALVAMSVAINKDPLTGVKNNYAYIANERRIVSAVAEKTACFAIVVLDINDLKYMNDRFGHDYGDEYIRKASQIICDIYRLSPVFRIGGDEFVALLEQEDYENRDALLQQVFDVSGKNVKTKEGIVIAAGMGVYEEGKTFNEVFHEADQNMYRHKKELKKKRPTHSLR